jgi:hypothetical protein
MEDPDKGGWYILAGVLGISILGGIIGSCDATSRYAQRIRTEPVRERMLEIAAGEDKILDIKEKRDLLKELGFNVVIDENSTLHTHTRHGDIHFSLNKKGRGKFIYQNHLGNIPRKQAEEYISRHTGGRDYLLHRDKIEKD